MSKKIVSLLVILAAVLACVFLGGAAGGKKFVAVNVKDDGIIVYNENFKIPFNARLRAYFVYKNDYYKFFKQEGGDKKAADKILLGLYDDINALSSSISRSAKNAEVKWDGKDFTYTKEENGIISDGTALINNIFAAFADVICVETKKEPLYPEITEEKLRLVTVKAGVFSTNYGASTANRKHNIELAVKRINGTVVPNNGKFSFNDTVGVRTEENGFLNAHVIEKGKFTDGIGGGVCQVSTTLYNAALLSGMSIDCAVHHSLPVSYVPLSLDAMVSSYQDFSFINNSGYPIYISGKADGQSVEFTFYGKKPFDGLYAELRSITVKEHPYFTYELTTAPELLEEGEDEKIIKSPKSGYTSESYLDLYEDGKIISSVKLRRDYYAPQKGIIAVRENPAENGANEIIKMPEAG